MSTSWAAIARGATNKSDGNVNLRLRTDIMYAVFGEFVLSVPSPSRYYFITVTITGFTC